MLVPDVFSTHIVFVCRFRIKNRFFFRFEKKQTETCVKGVICKN